MSLFCFFNKPALDKNERVARVFDPKVRSNLWICSNIHGLHHGLYDRSKNGWTHRISFDLFIHMSPEVEARVCAQIPWFLNRLFLMVCPSTIHTDVFWLLSSLDRNETKLRTEFCQLKPSPLLPHLISGFPRTALC